MNETQIINYLNKNKIEKYDIPAYINTVSIKAIKREDISILLNNINYESKVITKEEAKRILNLGDVIFDRLLKNSKSLFTSTDVLLKSEIEDIKNMQIEFWEKHITQKELINKYKIKPHQIKFKKVNIPDYAKVIDLDKIKLAIRIEDIEKKYEIHSIKNNLQEDITFGIATEYALSPRDIERILDLSEYNVRNLLNEFKFDYAIKEYGERYFKKEDIENIKKMQVEFFNENILTRKEMINKYGTKIQSMVNSYQIPIYAKKKSLHNTEWKGDLYYKFEDVKKYLSTKNKVIVGDSVINIDDIDMENNFETYQQRLSLMPDFEGFQGLIYTEKKWNEVAQLKLLETRSTRKVRNSYINAYIKSCKLLVDLLKSNRDKQGNIPEVYKLSTNQIKLFLKPLSYSYKRILFTFFRYVYQDIVYLKVKGRGFDINEINPYSRKYKNTQVKKEIYSFEEYKKIFNFLTNIDYHIEKVFELEGNDRTYYLSNWVYTLLHLNNAWRCSDITCFPRLNFIDIFHSEQINNLEWFIDNKISIEVSRKVISRIRHYDFRFNKTEAEGHFFCSDRLAPVLSTALFMAEISMQNIISLSNNSQYIIDFGTKYNFPTETSLSKFFKDVGIKNFKFGSKKMNKSIMSYVYSVSNPKQALFLSKYYRSHFDEHSTLHYLKLDKEHMDFIVENIFIRGEFGYIYDTFIDLIAGESENMTQRTKSIKNIRDVFGDETKIEALIGILNKYDSDEEVINILSNRSVDECIQIVSDIYNYNLPSRELDIQCLYSNEGCKCIDRESCLGCKYSIPTIYVLDKLCNSLINELNDYLNNSDNLIVKVKLSVSINQKVDILSQAINSYGKDYVYSCMDITREELMDKLKYLESPDFLLEDKLEQQKMYIDEYMNNVSN